MNKNMAIIDGEDSLSISVLRVEGLLLENALDLRLGRVFSQTCCRSQLRMHEEGIALKRQFDKMSCSIEVSWEYTVGAMMCS